MSEDVIVGVILAGGRGRRMGGREKFALTLAGERLVDIAARRLAPQVGTIVAASNRDVGGGLAWCADIFAGSMGPLAGLHAACVWAIKNLPEARAIASVPVDCPFFPLDLVSRLDAAGPPCFASDSERGHPIFGLWPLELTDQLRARCRRLLEMRVAPEPQILRPGIVRRPETSKCSQRIQIRAHTLDARGPIRIHPLQ